MRFFCESSTNMAAMTSRASQEYAKTIRDKYLH